MRTTLLVGLGLTLAAAAAVLVSPVLDLQIESVALLGAAVGAVVALVPDATLTRRALALLAGTAVAWIGYAVRAAVLPDSPGGRAVAVAVVILLCTALVAAGRERLPLWAALLGAGTFAGAYERVYAAAPPELASTSLTTLSTLLLMLTVGFLAAALTGPRVHDTQNENDQNQNDQNDGAQHESDQVDTDLDSLLSGSTTTEAHLENAR